MTRTIPLTQGLSAIVDDGDYSLVEPYKWHAAKDNRTFYARTAIYNGRNRPFRKITMHRLIVGALPGEKVDHWDGNGLNNRRVNLRWANTSQNGGNQRLPLNNTTGFKGVTYATRENRYQAALEFRGKLIWCGYHDSAEAAARAYNAAALEYFGKFARLNIIPENG